MLVSLQVGTYLFERPVFSTLTAVLRGEEVPLGDYYVLFKIRFPRIIMAVLIGASLAVSGTAMQGMFKNPLATPSLIGVTSGASLFAVIAIVLGGRLYPMLPISVRYSFLSIMAFCGAMLTMIFVYRMATVNKRTNIVVMLLAGVAISAISGSVTGFLTYLSSNEELRNLTFWMMGSLGGATWGQNLILLLVVIPSFGILLNKGKTLNALMLGEYDAAHLGVNVERVKRQIVVITALLVGTGVSFTGAIGFVGLIVPYILRLVFQSDYRLILPMSALGGAILLLSADTISRIVVAPSELPIGILTSFLGAPIFISILIHHKKMI